MENDKKKAFLFCLTYIFLFIGQALGYSMLVRFLTAIGYTATERSIMFAVAAAAAIFMSFGLGYLFDKTHAIKKYTYSINIVYAIFVFLVYVNNNRNFAYHLLTVGITSMIFRTNIGCFDSWCLESCEYTRENYGVIRAMGSIGWAIGTQICSAMINSVGYIGMAYALIVSTAGSFLSYSFIADAPKTHNTESLKMNDVMKLLGNKKYLYLVIALLFTMIMVTSIDYAVIDKMNIIGATASEISNFWTIAALLELPLFFLANRFSRKYGAIQMFTFATIVYMIRYILYGFSTSVSFMLISTSLQAVSYPVVMYVSKQLVINESPNNMKSSGLQVAMAIYTQASSLIAPLLAGVMEDGLGINPTLYVISLFGILAIMFVFLYMKEKKHSYNN